MLRDGNHDCHVHPRLQTTLAALKRLGAGDLLVASVDVEHEFGQRNQGRTVDDANGSTVGKRLFRIGDGWLDRSDAFGGFGKDRGQAKSGGCSRFGWRMRRVLRESRAAIAKYQT